MTNLSFRAIGTSAHSPTDRACGGPAAAVTLRPSPVMVMLVFRRARDDSARPVENEHEATTHPKDRCTGGGVGRVRRARVGASTAVAGAAEHHHHAAARLRPGAPPTTYFMDPDIVVVDPPSAASCREHADQATWTGALWCEGPAWSGQGRFSSGATFPTIVNCAGRKTMITCRCFAVRPTTATATRSTSRAGRSRANTSRGAWCATSTMARSDPRRHRSTASASTGRTTSRRIPMAATGSPIRRTAAVVRRAPDEAGGPSNPTGRSIRAWVSRRKWGG